MLPAWLTKEDPAKQVAKFRMISTFEATLRVVLGLVMIAYAALSHFEVLLGPTSYGRQEYREFADEKRAQVLRHLFRIYVVAFVLALVFPWLEGTFKAGMQGTFRDVVLSLATVFAHLFTYVYIGG
ncbi:unnamed protein product [Durusdinium trenchii]|uniref:Uncharacterized protein n=1 Tax=Durusdinium trenchii TaxID=1381693 RepID=A0ABP0P370_9DINO